MHPLLLSILCLSSVVAAAEQPCMESSLVFLWWQQVNMWYVRYDDTPCDGHDNSRYICEDSGWGNEEATVVCREQGYEYGLGRYIQVAPYSGGYGHIHCNGSETTLKDCDIGTVVGECNYVAVVSHCTHAPQVYVTGTTHTATFSQYLLGSEGFEIRFCVAVSGILTQTLSLSLTTHSNRSVYPPAIADYDYHLIGHTLLFEPADVILAEQCLQIEIIDDSLAEAWEKFTVHLSTDNSVVHLSYQLVDIYIYPSDDVGMNQCTQGSVTVVSDANNSSLQLVEMCSSSMGMWSPVCDHDWTPEDATVVCRELGYQGDVVHARLESEGIQSGGVAYECHGDESRLWDCMTPPLSPSPCYYALVHCSNETVMVDSVGPGTYTNSDDMPTAAISTTVFTQPSVRGPPPIPPTTRKVISSTTKTLSTTPASSSPSSSNTGPVIVGATVTVVALLFVVTVVVLVALSVWIKTKSRKMAERATGEPGQEGRNQKLPSLENPTYQATTIQPQSAHETATGPEYKFTNPLYSSVKSAASSEARSQSNYDYEYVESAFNRE